MKVKLRHFTKKDAAHLAEIANYKEVSDHLRDGFPHPYTRENAETFIQHALKQDPVTIFAITADGVHVGNIGLHPKEDIYHRTAELGYFITPDYWGKGIATKAIELILDYGFSDLNLIRIEAGIFHFNEASMRVLEKNRFKLEGISEKVAVKNGNIIDEHRFAILHPMYR